MKIFLLDNYDSFTYNLRQLLYKSGVNEVQIAKNDDVIIADIAFFDAIVLSPGPGLPQEAGKLFDVIDKYHSTKPIFGVCLGMQAIAQYFGSKLINLPNVLHGCRVTIDILEPNSLYINLPSPIYVGLYHSWAVDISTIPECLQITSYFENIPMSLKHKIFNIYGVQYHPESYMTDLGVEIMINWLRSIKK